MTKFLEADENEITKVNATWYGYPARGKPLDAIAEISIDDKTGVGWTLQHEIVYEAGDKKLCCVVDELTCDPAVLAKLKDEKKEKFDKLKEPKKEEKLASLPKEKS